MRAMSDQTKYAKLREFYLGQYRPLYDRFVTEGASAQELHAEIAAAFDHLMRKGGDAPEDIAPTQIDKIIGHIKRATFDAFKILFRKGIYDPYLALKDRKYADVHDGQFHQELDVLWDRASKISCEARALETLSGTIDSVQWGKAFAKWNEILPIVDEFRGLMKSPEVGRAKVNARCSLIYSIAGKLLWAVIGAVLSIVIAKLI